MQNNGNLPCVLCGSNSFVELFDVGTRSIVSCAKCGLTVTKNFIPPNYNQYHRDEEYQRSQKLFENIFLKRVKTIEKYKQRGKALEIGCSIGILLGLMKNRGWEVWGVEPSKSAAVAAKRGIRIINKFFEEADLPKNYFDVVILNHTLEHLTDPLGVLTKAKTLLKKGGIIFVDVPNFGSFSSQVLGKSWPYLAPDEHVWHFTPQTLKKLLEKAGFRLVNWGANSGIFDWGSPVKGLFDKLTALRKSLFVDFATAPFAFINTKRKMGTSLTMIGRK
jgi:2-polyprenyl-3-methyl-5-hydroxy-6-metoxy-1,4-benzoquinol methylase